MKTYFYIFLFLNCCITSFGQNIHDQPIPPEHQNNTFSKVATEAQFPGGSESWLKFLEENLNTNIPRNNNAPKGEYRVVVYFGVSENGKINDIKAETSFGFGMEEEAIRVMNSSPKWIPSKVDKEKRESHERRIITFIIK